MRPDSFDLFFESLHRQGVRAGEEEGVSNPPPVFLKCFDDAILPVRKTLRSAGLDICAHNLIKRCGHGLTLVEGFHSVSLEPGYDCLIGTGIKLNMDNMYPFYDSMFIMALRSSMRAGGMTQGGIAIIDVDYPSEISVYIRNAGTTPYVIKKGQRIAQLIPVPVKTTHWFFNQYTESVTRSGGLGSTGGV